MEKDKNFRPVIVVANPEKGRLNEAYGITDARRVELSGKMDRSIDPYRRSMVAFHDRIDEIADIADTLEEFVFCLVVHTIFLERNPDLKILTNE